MTATETPPSRGRPRDVRTQLAILSATRDLLLEAGYTRLSIEAVAERAGAGKATVYRWWRNKGELVLEAAADSIDIGVVPDTGDTRGDLFVAVQQLIDTFSDRLAAIVIFAVIARLEEDPAMAETFRDTAVGPWRRSAMDAIERGIARGDLPTDMDAAFALDVIVGTVFQRTLVVPEPITDGLARDLIDLLSQPD